MGFSSSKRLQTLALIGLVAAAAPVALVFETLLRSLLFPIIAPDFEMARSFLEPFLTPIGWALVAVAASAGIMGALLQGRIAARRLSRLPAGAGPDAREAVRNQVFFITSSIPQIPTIVSTFAFMFGASVIPTLVGVAVCTAAIVWQGIALRRSARDSG